MIENNVRTTLVDKAMITNPKSSLELTKRLNVWLNIHTRTEHEILQESVEQGTDEKTKT